MDTIDEEKKDNANYFFDWIKRCDHPHHPQHKGKCTYLGSLDSRLKIWRSMGPEEEKD